ncbi:MAG: HAD-IC family P-type ATPase [Methanotrichaceae archaeon]|nr:HAD-IC family P-type ATPase [Methanotrichaceae archaeon]
MTLQQAHRIADQQELYRALDSSPHGLSRAEAESRLSKYGKNTLPQPQATSVAQLFIRQFKSPLIYILLAAALVSLLLQETSDAFFITAVLLINALIGTVQEYSAERSAEALRGLVTTYSRVLRDGEAFEINSQELVPGDVVLLEDGSRVPADLRLTFDHSLEIDESLLTGESVSVSKDPEAAVDADAPLGDRKNMAFAGTMVTRGRGQGLVVATGLETELGHLASTLLSRQETKPPLVVKMEKFTSKIAKAVGLTVLAIFAIELYRGLPWQEVFLESVALAVSAIPEGLPVAMTVALAIGMNRMAKKNVIVRRLVAVETLGSCNYIASDKTGTLTLNQLTARLISVFGQQTWEITGEGTIPEGCIRTVHGSPTEKEETLIRRIALVCALCNEAFLGLRNGEWVHHGDAVDVALLVMAHKAGVVQPEARAAFPQVDQIPFESERQFSATLNRVDGGLQVLVKGAPEKIVRMCSYMAAPEGDCQLDHGMLDTQAQSLANSGYRLLALASGNIDLKPGESFSEEHLRGLTHLGFVGMIDPLRPEAGPAIEECRKAGIRIGMITGDHPITALAIARELKMAETLDQVVTGPDLRAAEEKGIKALDQITSRARVFARVEPRQKLDIVSSLLRQGYVVAVTGDGANDAPAMHAAHVGVAMGKGGTDVAKESAELVITDDNFASIVAGIDEGRVVYSNVRKVIFLLISTGAAEIALFILALLAGLPLPLLAVQLLWLNLVTNGIQDVALAFEPAEGDEMEKPPRPPNEPVFNRIMLERIGLSAAVIGGVSFGLYNWLLGMGWSLEEARNSVVLLMVLFENVQVFNSRSELRSAFNHDPLRNRLLFFGTLAAQAVHIAAMYTPGLSDVLQIQPVTLEQWVMLLLLALSILVVMEIHKAFRRGHPIDVMEPQRHRGTES